MKNFRPLNNQEHEKVWDKFDNLLNFKPSIKDFPGITTSRPQLKFDIKECFSEPFQMDKLEKLGLYLFDKITKHGERIYALDYMHQCYDFDPRQEIERDEFNEWIVPIYPNGDYYIFLTKDFNNIWFGHPWEKTITLLGKDIVGHGLQIISDFNDLKITEHNNGEHP